MDVGGCYGRRRPGSTICFVLMRGPAGSLRRGVKVSAGRNDGSCGNTIRRRPRLDTDGGRQLPTASSLPEDRVPARRRCAVPLDGARLLPCGSTNRARRDDLGGLHVPLRPLVPTTTTRLALAPATPWFCFTAKQSGIRHPRCPAPARSAPARHVSSMAIPGQVVRTDMRLRLDSTTPPRPAHWTPPRRPCSSRRTTERGMVEWTETHGGSAVSPGWP